MVVFEGFTVHTGPGPVRARLNFIFGEGRVGGDLGAPPGIAGLFFESCPVPAQLRPKMRNYVCTLKIHVCLSHDACCDRSPYSLSRTMSHNTFPTLWPETPLYSVM